jgi:xanthine dehydrogenase small subunit
MTRFWLNDELVETDESPGRLILDYVRKNRLTGTKEGCKEGDCGACTILVGHLEGDRVRYEPVTSCLVPLGEMQGKHVVTIEGLNFRRRLSLVQDAMVRFGGTQCGYCTPGFIVSMTWYLMADEAEPTMDGFKAAISGNLCRCTGYNSITRAGASILEALGPDGDYSQVWSADDRIGALVDAELIPDYFAEMPARLSELKRPEPNGAGAEFFIAGGTDLYVQRGREIPGAHVSLLNARDTHPQWKGVHELEGALLVGALTTFTEFAEDERIRALIPRMDEFLWLIASLHIRNRATLGGNIVNASPIGDMTNLLLALGASVVLNNGGDERVVALEDFFLGYKQLDKADDEIVSKIVIPAGSEDTHVNFEKVSKRKALDIASVCSGARFLVREGTIVSARISMGGVAATPLLLRKTGEFLAGKPLEVDTIRAALSVAQSEVSPISDVRGSANYKRLLVKQLIIAHVSELFGIDATALLTPAPEAAHG